MTELDHLIETISKDNLAAFCIKKSGDFKPSVHSQITAQTIDLFPLQYQQKFASVDIVGYFLDMEIFVFAIKLHDGLSLSERSCRRMQFDYAKLVLKKATNTQYDNFTIWLGNEAPTGKINKALFIFFDDAGSFRFSLVEVLDPKSEAPKRYRRYTFFVDPSQNNRTFKERMAKAWTSWQDLKEAFSVERLNKEFYNDLFKWYERTVKAPDVVFPCETVTPKEGEKEDIFRTRIKSEQVIRLITRLLFVWFIKQKKLVPEELFTVEGDSSLKSILKNFNPKQGDNYYRAVLQNLFFATLNSEINCRDFAADGSLDDNREHFDIKTLYRYGSEFALPKEKILALFRNIPFLNGGLFECLDRGKKYFDGFSRNPDKVAHVPNAFFFDEDENALGLIPLLRRYNFTIDENASNDEDIALDPELLGKIFENLLAALVPDTSITARKATGSFYTPREIVNYMVDESLVAHLLTKMEGAESRNDKAQTDEKEKILRRLFTEGVRPSEESLCQRLDEALTTAKILDPACGSGAFPMGVLLRMVELLCILRSIPAGESLYDLKLQLIENCIYGIDIQCIAVQVSKLRFFISLVCEQMPNNDPITNYGINPLPNLETKFVAADSLIGLPAMEQNVLDLSSGNIAQLKEELWDIRHKHFQARTYREKKKLRQQDLDKRDEIEKTIKKATAPNFEELTKLKKQREKFEKPDWIVRENDGDEQFYLFADIANEVKEKSKTYDANASARKEIDAKIAIEEKKQNTPFTIVDEIAQKLAGWDPYDQNASSPFFDPEWMFNVKDGFDVVIGNPPYVEAKKLKEVVAPIKQYYECYSGTADLSVYFYEKGLSLCKKNGVLTYICTNKFFNTGYGKKLRAFILSHSLLQILNFEQCEVFENVLVSSVITLIKKSTAPVDGIIKFFNWYKLNRKDFLRSFGQNSINLKNYPLSVMSAEEWSFSDTVELSIKNKIKQGNFLLKNIEGISIYRGVTTGYNPAFIITDEQRKQLIDDTKNADIIKKMLQGKNIRKWFYNESNEYLLQTGYDADIKSMYPVVYKHLLGFYDKLYERADQGKNWWNLRACKFYNEFEQKDKIIWGLTADKWAFAYDEKQHYLPSNGYILTSTTLPIKYILGLLNSNLLKYYFSFIGVMTAGGAYTLKHDTISKLPFPSARGDQQQPVIALVDRILVAKKANPSADTSSLEAEIDQLVYQLYGLNQEEIAIVEASSKKSISPSPATSSAQPSDVPAEDDDSDDARD